MFRRLLLIFLLLPPTAFAEGLPRPQSDTVSDFAKILPNADEDQVRTLLREIRTETGVHIVVVTMDRISDHGGWGKSFETYATALFNAWGVGDLGKNDGILILVAAGQRETRIELGSGYGWAYDGRARDILETTVLPRFRAKQMALGILDGVAATRDKIVEPFVEGQWVGLSDYGRIILIGLAGAAGVAFAGRTAWATYVRCPRCGQPGLLRENEVVERATLYSVGRGVTHVSCSVCGYKEDRPYSIQRDDDNDSDSSGGWSGGSSGSGFGGGRSSGGGASGKW